MVKQIVYTFCLTHAFCKPVSCELSKLHILKLHLDIIVSSPAHWSLNSFNGYVHRVNQRLMYCFNGPIIYELSMPKFQSRFFGRRGLI